MIFYDTAAQSFHLNNNDKSSSDFLTVLAHKISQRSGDKRETVFLFQRISVLLQRFNSILLHDSFVREDCPK